MKIGVLVLQGAFREHIRAINKLGCNAVGIQKPEELDEVQGLIILGGKSAATGKLMIENRILEKILEKIIERAEEGMPVFGMGTGMTLLAKEVDESGLPTLALMDIAVIKDTSGDQEKSFQADLYIPAFGPKPLQAVLIGSLYIIRVKPNVGILSIYDDKIIMARQGDFLACSFYPRLTDDSRVYQYFLKMVEDYLAFNKEKNII
ncbi:MAG: glutamine amidotransferase [Peptococcaceae bacterium]|jgi:5'-phosphate synthase pdxT subunit|nr:glutamine amidotransferase [Peptococcaceae bacterium]